MKDISRVIANTSVVYPGDDLITQSSICEISPGCPCKITALGGWSTHFLTHVDPPAHFIDGGATLDDIPLSRFAGKCKVVEVPGNMILPADIERAGDVKGWNILFKTLNSNIPTEAPFAENHVYVSEEAALLVVKRSVNMIGIDYLSVDQFGDQRYPAHRTLLGNDVLILEGLDLSDIREGEYDLLALPLKISKGDGSPVRAVLR